ncbi:MAG: type II secretion system F family protein [Bacillota bacterium]
MAVFEYRARDGTGQAVSGFLEAGNELEAARQLRDKGLFVIDIRRARKRLMPQWRSLLSPKVGKRDLALFCRQLAAMLEAGIPIVSALRILAIQADNRNLRAAIDSVIGGLSRGLMFHQALGESGGVFPPVVVRAVEAAESGGTLDEALEELATHLEREHELEEKVKSALVYPSVVVVTAIVVLVILMVFVLPAFQNMLESLGVPLPGLTIAIMGASNALRQAWPMLLAVLIVAAYAVYRVLRTERSRYRWDSLILKMPVIGTVYHKTILARFSRTLSTLLRSGVPIIQAMDVVGRTVGNRVVAEAIRSVQESIRQGRGILGPLQESGLFPPMVVEMMAVGEETGELDALLARISTFYEREVWESVSRLSSLIEPVLIVFLGIMVGFVVISVLLPYFQVLGSIG